MKNQYLWTIAIFLVVIELFSVLPPKNENFNNERDFERQDIARGVIHVHSVFSDGGGSPRDIADAASEAGLDFVVLTDHNTDEARKKGFEKNYGKTDLFVEMESSTPVGHAISFFSESSSLKNMTGEKIVSATYQQFLNNERYSGLFSAIAHPSNVKMPWGRLDQFPEGLEVVNFDSSWRRQLSDSPLQFLVTIGIYPFNAFLSAVRFFEIYPKDFAAWDEMTSRGPGHFAYLAHDTHSKVKINPSQFFRWPDYLETFKLASNVLFLSGPKAQDFESRKIQYYKSLREGRVAIHYHSVYPFLSNRWEMRCDGQEYGPGDVISVSKKCEAIVHTPKTPFDKAVRVIKNGEVVKEWLLPAESTASETLPLVSPGSYRIEVWAKLHTALRLALSEPVPYVFYSHIYLQ